MTYNNLKRRLDIVMSNLILRPRDSEIDKDDPLVEDINDIFQQIIFENLDDNGHKRIDAWTLNC